MPCRDDEITRADFARMLGLHIKLFIQESGDPTLPKARKTWEDWYYNLAEVKHYIANKPPKEWLDDYELMEVLEISEREFDLKKLEPGFPKIDRKLGWSRLEMLAWKDSHDPD